MKRKKIVKQLMAIGVNRNDAAAFARAYHRVMWAKREDLFPEIIKPAMPAIGTIERHETRTLRAECLISAHQMMVGNEHLDAFKDRIMENLAEELAKGMLEGGAAVLRMEQILGRGTRFSVTTKVVMPGVE